MKGAGEDERAMMSYINSKLHMGFSHFCMFEISVHFPVDGFNQLIGNTFLTFLGGTQNGACYKQWFLKFRKNIVIRGRIDRT